MPVSKKVSVSRMRDGASWRNERTLKKFLSLELAAGRLTLVVGAGVSQEFGLPNWPELTAKIFEDARLEKPDGADRMTEEELATVLLSDGFHNNDVEFARAIGRSLYPEDFKLDLERLKDNALLLAITAMAIALRTSPNPAVVTFNFDNILETYLKYFGFRVASIRDLPLWEESKEVFVYHPHGLIPMEQRDDVGRGVVFASTHYDRILGDRELWNNRLDETFSSSTCLFIGLSGRDKNLRTRLGAAKRQHPAIQRLRHAYWGVRFSDESSDPMQREWRERGVKQVTLRSYAELPQWLFDIAQGAAPVR